MTPSTHTPGPWEKVPYPATAGTDISICARTKSDNPRYIARVFGEGVLYKGNQDERIANANLIAAAPELLAALEWVIDCNAVMDNACRVAARAAISKAKGGA